MRILTNQHYEFVASCIAMLSLLVGCCATDSPKIFETQVLADPVEFTTKPELVPFEVEESNSEASIGDATSTPITPMAELQDEQTIGTLTEILDLAIAINPAIAEAEAELESLRGKWLQIGLYPNPVAGINGQDVNENGSPGRYGIYVSQKQVRSNRLNFGRETVEAEIQAQRWKIIELQQRLMTDVKLRFYDLLIAQKKKSLASELVQISREGLEATKQLVDAKELARTSLLQAEVELENAKVILLRTENEILAARRYLAALVDQTDLPFSTINGSLQNYGNGESEIESALATLLTSSPEIVGKQAEVEMARRNLKHQCAIGVADANWQAGLAYDFASDDFIPSFQLGIPIQRFNRNQGAIAEAKHRVVARQRDVDKVAMDLRQRLVAVVQTYQDAKIQVEAIENNIAPNAEESLRLIFNGYQSGEVDFLSLLTAQRTYFQINLDKISQLRILWRQKILTEGLLLDQSIR
ncbi:MAG: TolC family protein [Planctomycetota bacterium]